MLQTTALALAAPNHSAVSVRHVPSPCTCASRPQVKRHATSASLGTPFDTPSAYSSKNHDWSINGEWLSRATCARQGAMAAVKAAGLAYGMLGVTAATEHPVAAQALLCTGSCSDCNATKAVIAQLGASSEVPSTAGRWMRQLWTHGVAPFNASWGFGEILRTNGLASFLRHRLDNESRDKMVLLDAPAEAIRHLSEAVLSRLRPIALSYLGGQATYGGCKLLLLPGRNLTAKEYISGMWHHDRCGRRLKCFVFLRLTSSASS